MLLTDKAPSGLKGRFLAILRETILETDRATIEVRAFAALVRDRDRAAFDARLEGCRSGPT